MIPPFKSVLKSELQAFLSHKHALGYRYERPEGTLRNFDRHVCKMHKSARRQPDLCNLIKSWVAAQAQGRKAITVGNDLSIIRQFCLYRRRLDPGGFVPDRQMASAVS